MGSAPWPRTSGRALEIAHGMLWSVAQVWTPCGRPEPCGGDFALRAEKTQLQSSAALPAEAETTPLSPSRTKGTQHNR